MRPASRVEGSTGRFVARSEFDRLAPRYERGSRVMSLGQIVRWRKKAVAALRPRAGGAYVDVGAGTGELARELLRRWPDVRVTALDASAAMLRAGGLTEIARLTVRVGDAAETGLAPAAFDGALCGFVLRHLDDRPRFFAEMRRILRPGGRLVLLEAHVPPGRLRRALFHVYFTAVAWPLGALVTSTWRAHVGLRKSLHAFAGVDAIRQEAARAGLREVGLERGEWTGFFLLVVEAPESSR